MVALNTNPGVALKAFLVRMGVTTAIYTGESPTSKLPSEFIEILHNGPVGSEASKLGIATCTMTMGIYVKLLSTDEVNIQRESAIIGSFQSFFSSAVVESGFTFSLDKKRMMIYQGRSVRSGYSTKLINILTSIT